MTWSAARESGLHDAESNLLVVVAFVVVPVASVILVDQRRARLERLFDVEDRGQGLVVDANGGAGGACGRLALGNHRGHRLAPVAHLVEGERRLVVGPEPEENEKSVHSLGHILESEDAHHARHARRRGGIHRTYPRMVVGAARELHLQHPRHRMVFVEAVVPGHVALRVLALGRPADLVQILVALPREQVLSEFHCLLLLTRSGALRRGRRRFGSLPPRRGWRR